MIADDRRAYERRQSERRQNEDSGTENRRQQDRRKQERRSLIYSAGEANPQEWDMRVHAGQIVKADGKVVQVIRAVAGLSEYWLCDDGQVYEQRMFAPANIAEIRMKAREIGRRLTHPAQPGDWDKPV